MIVYHIDKFGLLQPGQKIAGIGDIEVFNACKNKSLCDINRFFDGTLQMFALQTLKEMESGDRNLALTEAVLEYVRALKFAKLPSRLAVLYASRTIEEAEQWQHAMRPANPESCIVSLCTGHKVYSSNFVLRDEVYRHIAELSEDDRNTAPWGGCETLARTLRAAESYWKSTAPSRRALCSHNMGSEELLVVPPVKVIGKVKP